MDITPDIQEAINSFIKTYIQAISTYFNIPEEEAIVVWKEGDIAPEKLEVDYNALTRLQLREICKERNLKILSTMKKNEMIALLKGDVPVIPVKVEKKKKTQSSVTPKVISAVFGNCGSIVVRRNGFGNFEHRKTGFVFNNKTLRVVGKQLEDGSVAEITREDIEVCHMWKFKFELPLNLNKDATNLDSFALDELKESDFEETDDDDEGEEEEDEVDDD